MKSRIIALLTAGLLSGCVTVHSDTTAGLSVVRYDGETMNKVALEMEGRACPALNKLMNDYLVLRDQARVK